MGAWEHGGMGAWEHGSVGVWENEDMGAGQVGMGAVWGAACSVVG